MLDDFWGKMQTLRTLTTITLAACTTLLAGCADTVSGSDVDEQAEASQCTDPGIVGFTENQYLRVSPISGAELGSGVMRQAGDAPREVCQPLADNPRMRWINLQLGRGFVAECPSDINERLLKPLAAQGYWEWERIDQIQTFFENYFAQNPGAKLQVVAESVVTAARSVRRDLDLESFGACADAPQQPEEPREGIRWFVENCGEHYVSSEVLGGIVVAFADLNETPAVLQGDVNSVLLGGAMSDDDGGQNVTCEACEHLDDADIPVGLITSGFPGPNGQPEGSFLPETSQHVAAYMATYEQKTADAYNDDDFDSPALGAVLEQLRKPYNRLDVARCIGADAVPDGYYWYSELNREAGETLWLIDRLKRLYGYQLDFPDIHKWEEPAHAAQEARRRARLKLRDCADEVDDAMDSCDYAMRYGGDIHLSCEMPELCELDDIEELHEELPHVEPK